MPIYGYRCNACEHTLDALQKMSEAPLVDCPECGEASLKRMLSAPRFRLKGQGWYETDFKKDNQRNLAGDANSSSSSSGSNSSKTSDKSATKSSDSSASKSDTKTSTSTS